MTDYGVLKRLAEETRVSPINSVQRDRDIVHFQRAASPAVVLTLIAEIEELRKDAERYRWLMSDAVNNGTLGIDGGWIDFGFKDEAAEIIDEALSKGVKPK